MSPGAYDVFWKAMSPEIIAHPGKLIIHYNNSENIKSLDANRKKNSYNFFIIHHRGCNVRNSKCHPSGSIHYRIQKRSRRVAYDHFECTKAIRK
jgi:hypothetical protein